MGWLSMTRAGMGLAATPNAYLDAQFTYERAQEDGSVKALRVLKSTCGGGLYHAAAQPYVRDATGETPQAVFAIMCLVRWTPRANDGYVFAYKDMDESCGPSEARCPASILALLGPAHNEYAANWRRRCLARLRMRDRPIADGMKIRFAVPMRFSDGHEGDSFSIEKRGNAIVLIGPQGRRYHANNIREAAWSAIPETRVHSPRFAPRS